MSKIEKILKYKVENFLPIYLRGTPMYVPNTSS